MGEKKITVCDSCLCASCWQYIHLCENHREAGTRQMTRAELKAIGREHPSYWKTDYELTREPA